MRMPPRAAGAGLRRRGEHQARPPADVPNPRLRRAPKPAAKGPSADHGSDSCCDRRASAATPHATDGFAPRRCRRQRCAERRASASYRRSLHSEESTITRWHRSLLPLRPRMVRRASAEGRSEYERTTEAGASARLPQSRSSITSPHNGAIADCETANRYLGVDPRLPSSAHGTRITVRDGWRSASLQLSAASSHSAAYAWCHHARADAVHPCRSTRSRRALTSPASRPGRSIPRSVPPP